jgi:hypothetical protein
MIILKFGLTGFCIIFYLSLNFSVVVLTLFTDILIKYTIFPLLICYKLFCCFISLLFYALDLLLFVRKQKSAYLSLSKNFFFFSSAVGDKVVRSFFLIFQEIILHNIVDIQVPGGDSDIFHSLHA